MTDALEARYLLKYGKHSVEVWVFRGVAGFLNATNKISRNPNRMACYISAEKTPKTGQQGVVAAPKKYLTVSVLAHEFMHLSHKMAEKNGEEKAVSAASQMFAGTLTMLRRDGFKLPETCPLKDRNHARR